MTDILTVLSAAAANVTGTAFDAGDLKDGAALEVVTAGTVSAFSVQLQGSLDGANWFSIGSPLTTATTSGESAGFLARWFRAVLSGYSGTGTVTARVGFEAGAGSSPAAPAQQGFQPSDAGFLAWTFDAATCASVKLVGGGNVILARVPVRSAISVTNVVAAITVAGSVLTASENFAGLFSSAGTLIASTADQSAVWTTAGVYAMALSGAPYTLQPGYYWVAILANGTTAPTFLAGSALATAAPNAGFTVATARGAFSGSGKTSLANITPASNSFYVTLWAALS